MIVLIDYDNLNASMRSRGLDFVIQRLVEHIGHLTPDRMALIKCRLYGGWFYKKKTSRNAERLIPQIQQGFPRVFTVNRDQEKRQVSISVRLALSLACDPAVKLTHTFRPRSVPPNLICKRMPFAGCAYPDACSIKVIRDMLKDQECPIAKCNTPLNKVIARPEQKLVDAMLVADLIHYGQNSPDILVVVSGDDDLWPGIRAALVSGARIFHLIPRRHNKHAYLYRELRTGLYSRLSM